MLLAAQQANNVTTRYTQDSASLLPQVLQTQATGAAAPTDYLYGQPTSLAGDAERLASTTSGSSTHSWYVSDLQGSVRYTQDDTGSSGTSLNDDPAPLQYDPYGAAGTRDSGLKPQISGYRAAFFSYRPRGGLHPHVKRPPRDYSSHPHPHLISRRLCPALPARSRPTSAWRWTHGS